MPADSIPSTAAPTLAAVAASFQKIQRFVVLMFENRSFDHLAGFLKASNPAVAGLAGTEANYSNPNAPVPPPVTVGPATSYLLNFDPGHEFEDVQMQLYGPNGTPPPTANPPTDPAPMSGFVCCAARAATAAGVPGAAQRIMECFMPSQVTVLSALARQFALMNFWHSSLPGPTWPNRFFAHAATSGGLTDGPSDEQIIGGFSFANGAIYQRLAAAGKEWRIYHDGLPQAAGINSLRLEYVDPFTKHFREMKFFADDVKSGSLPEYTFIEPNYDSGANYVNGNSMHPLNDIRKGELLLKQVYETLRNSKYWRDTMLIITFDEHGGFYDHVPPPATVPSGDDTTHLNPAHPFAFDRLGVRVPAIVVSAYTQAGTVIGADAGDPATVFDHSSILATVEKRFGLEPLTLRDEAARTLDIALNLPDARDDAPATLPDPAADIH
jgi:phospholipase C